MILVWTVAIILAIGAKILLPPVIGWRNKLITTRQAWQIPIVVAGCVSVIRVIAHLIGSQWQTIWWIVGLVVVGYPIYRIIRREKVSNLAQRYKTDLTIVGVSTFTVVAANCLLYFVTSADPRIWAWYYGNAYFFWAWNFGWIVVAFLHSKRDDKNIVIPIAVTGRNWIMVILIAGLLINYVFYPSLPRWVNTLTTSGLGNLGTNFGQPDLLRLTPEEHKATHTALMKTPFAERKVLWALYECNPENKAFRPKDGDLPALKTYQSKGAQAFGDACVEKLTRARQTFVLAVVEATSEKWSDPVILPEALLYEIVYSSEERRHRTTVLGPDDGQQMELAEGYTVPPFKTVGAKFKSKAGTVRVTVEYRPTKGASSQ